MSPALMESSFEFGLEKSYLTLAVGFAFAAGGAIGGGGGGVRLKEEADSERE